MSRLGLLVYVVGPVALTTGIPLLMPRLGAAFGLGALVALVYMTAAVYYADANQGPAEWVIYYREGEDDD